MNKIVKRILIALGAFLGIIVLVVGGYVIYVVASYSRIEDNLALTPENASGGVVRTGEEYTVVTQNLGFGAYTADFTFFMDGGKESRARSADSVKACVSQGAEKVRSFDPDFAFFQEVDTGSTRSYDIDEREIVKSYFEGFSSSFAVNYHSAYLFYPISSRTARPTAACLRCRSPRLTRQRAEACLFLRACRSFSTSTAVTAFRECPSRAARSLCSSTCTCRLTAAATKSARRR